MSGEHLTASLSQLSAQLLANGFISRELDLISLFAVPSSLSSTSSTTSSTKSTITSVKSYNTHQSLLIAQNLARDQILKCLWNMLNSKNGDIELIEKLRTKLDVVEYEGERMRGMVGVERRLREKKEEEVEMEKAKAKQAIRDLTTEQERHRYAKEELTKAKNALQFVRTQVTHDNKRRDLSLSKALTSLQKQTSDITQSRFMILNAQPLLTPIPSNTNSNESIGLIQDTLRESEETRKELMVENRGLRELLGEVEEWIEGVESLRGFGFNEDREKVGSGDGLEDESLHIPLPHFSRSLPSFTSLLSTKLTSLSSSLTSLLSSIDQQLIQARSEMSDELERERLGKIGEKMERVRLEKELEEMRERVEEGEKVLEGFLKAGVLGGGKEVGEGEEAEEEDDDIVIPPPKASEIKSVAVAPKSKKLAEFESKRAQSVKDFLGDLGLDSPIQSSSTLPPAPATKKVVTTTTSSSSTSTLPTQKPVRRPTTAPSKGGKPHLSPLSEKSEPSSSSSKSSSSVPSPFLSATSTTTKSTGAGASMSALAGILAMADSPPPAVPTKEKERERKVSSTTTSSTRTVPILGANRGAGTTMERVRTVSTTTTATGTLKKSVSVLKGSSATGQPSGREKEKENAKDGIRPAGTGSGQVRLKALGEARGSIRGM